MAQVVYNPVLHENVETRGIVNTNQLNLNVEMPDEYRNWLKTAKTSLSTQGCSFQSVNTNKFMDSNVRLDLQFQVTISGITQAPGVSAGTPATQGGGTPPTFWSEFSCGVDPFCINKLISRIAFNIQNKQWSETQRTPELFDILGTQFDQKKLESYGIIPYELQGDVQLDRMVGRGAVSRNNYHVMFVPTLTNFSYLNLRTSLTSVPDKLTPMQRAVINGYVSIDNVTFTTNEVGVTLKSVYHPEFGCQIPINNADQSVYYSSPNTAVLTQVVTFTVHEYLISPSLSNPYTKNPYSKSYYVGNYPVNMTFDFNSNYLTAMFKNMVPTYRGAAVQVPTISPTLITDANLLFYTFDTSKELISPYQRTIFYNLDFQNLNQPAPIPVNNFATTQTSIATTSNLTSLPPYIMGWVSCPLYLNNTTLVAAYGAPSNRVDALASNIYCPIQNLTIQWGSQTDAMNGVQLTWREITDITMEVVKDPSLYNLIRGSNTVGTATCPFNYAQAGQYQNAIFAQIDYSAVSYTPQYLQGMTFFILPTARLNWRPIIQSDVATIPEFNYGSNNYKSMVINMTWQLPSVLANAPGNPSVNCIPSIVLLTKRVRSIPIDGQGPLFDEMIEYDYMNDTNRLATILESYYLRNNSANDANLEVQFVGGAFLGDVLKHVKEALPTISGIVHGVNALTRGQSGAVASALHRGTELASHALHAIGGRKVGRPRKY